MRQSFKIILLCAGLMAVPALLGACSGIEREAKYPTGADRSSSGGDIYAEPESIFGKDGLSLLGKKPEDNAGANGIEVNSFLWRASLDTVSFMPLASADPFGGVILTDWYTPAETPDERFKINVFILGRELRSDGVRVRIFKQRRELGDWRDIPATKETVRQLEDAILTRARQLRIAQIDRDD